ncbi:MAG: hypothetical protein OQK78_09560, partial [Gammaproteobacteria bacterium]|nr:hypothetical protein [Gammaproteobacteria bacterium]
VKNAKSVALLPDSFSSPYPGQQTSIRNLSKAMLYRTNLEYVERPASVESGIKGSVQFERMRSDAKEERDSSGQLLQRKYIFEPIESITAEYIVRPKVITIEDSNKSGLGGAEIEVYRREDNKLISRVRYFWSNRLFESCPEKVNRGSYPYHFITESLGMKNN